MEREVAGKSVLQGGMEEAPENGKESPHSVHANGLIDGSVGIFTNCPHIDIFLFILNK